MTPEYSCHGCRRIKYAVTVPINNFAVSRTAFGGPGDAQFCLRHDLPRKEIHQCVRRPWLQFEATPIVVAGTMFLTTPFNRVVALDPETGRKKWNFDPRIDFRARYSEGLVNRGVTLWSDTNAAETATCRQRIFLATIDARLFALDASTGHPCDDFGIAGQINLKEGISNIKRDGEYEETSAPAVIDDLVIVGSSIADNDRVDSPDGAVRAFCARTGKFRWSWQPIQANLTPTGAGNVWSTISVDAQRDLVFCRPAAQVRIITASSDRVTTNGRTRSLRCQPAPASWYGASSSFITICGTRYSRAAHTRRVASR